MSIEPLCTHQIKKVSNASTIQEAAKMMSDHQIGSLFVEKNGEFIGIVTETDITQRAAARGIDLKKEKVEAIMSSPLISLEKDRSAQDAFDLMGDERVRHLGVTDRGKVVGIISVRDLLVHFKKQSEPQMGID